MKRPTTIVTVIFLLGISLSTWVVAQDTSPKDPYSGDILSRSTLTGDWWGIRNQLADKGVTFDLSVIQVEQGVVNGGKSGIWEYGGRGDMVISADSGKMGLWPGAFLNLEVEGNWPSSVNAKTGALMPVNSSQLYPVPGGDYFGVSALNFTQFLSPYFGLTVGKYATVTTTSGDMNEFAHGKGATNFMNLALNFYPGFAFTVPYSTLGAGVIVLPTKDPKQAIISFLVMSTNGTAKTSGFEDLNGDAISLALEGRVRTDFFGLTGHQLLGTTYSDKTFTSIDQRLGSIIETRMLAKTNGSWNVYYNFDQYLYQPKKDVDQGMGVFGRLGVSDGNPDLMKFFGSFGVGGTGMFDSRPHDKFGLGFYYININNPTFQGPLQTRNFLRDEYGFEAFYDVAITPWMLLTPDLQVINGAQKNTVNIVRDPLGLPRIQRNSIDTAVVLGVRLQMVF
jgi:porin